MVKLRAVRRRIIMMRPRKGDWKPKNPIDHRELRTS